MSVCSLCGFAFLPGGTACRERSCPLAVLGCAGEHCPRCGHSLPDETKSLLARGVRWLVARTKRAVAPSASRLTDLDAGSKATVAAFAGNAALEARLTAQGLVPGVEIRLVQRWPAFIVEMGESTLAFERRVAEAIRLEPSSPS
jgi:Fe2+ transport system protein FeoA